MAYKTDKFDSRVVKILNDGGAGLLPTDTIYGLSCRALDQVAVQHLYKLKVRAADKPFIILISDMKMLDLLSISREQAMFVDKYWPGPLSAILPAPEAPDWLTRGTGTLAIRLPDNDGLKKLISQTGPLISTSANLQGNQPVDSIAEAEAVFGDSLDFYVDIGKLDNPPSTLVEIVDGKLRAVRQGAVKID